MCCMCGLIESIATFRKELIEFTTSFGSRVTILLPKKTIDFKMNLFKFIPFNAIESGGDVTLQFVIITQFVMTLQTTLNCNADSNTSYFKLRCDGNAICNVLQIASEFYHLKILNRRKN